MSSNSSSNSSSPKVASLTSKLLVAKGDANTSGFTAQHAAAAKARASASAHPTSHALAAAKDGTQMTLRLDATQLRRLRLAAAHLDLGEQGFLLAALDHYIDHVVAPLLEGHCSCLETEHKPSRQAAIGFARQKSDLPQ